MAFIIMRSNPDEDGKRLDRRCSVMLDVTAERAAPHYTEIDVAECAWERFSNERAV